MGFRDREEACRSVNMVRRYCLSLLCEFQKGYWSYEKYDFDKIIEFRSKVSVLSFTNLPQQIFCKTIFRKHGQFYCWVICKKYFIEYSYWLKTTVPKMHHFEVNYRGKKNFILSIYPFYRTGQKLLARTNLQHLFSSDCTHIDVCRPKFVRRCGKDQ